MSYINSIIKVENLCKQAYKLSLKYQIILITSHKDKTKNTGNYDTCSVCSEFYSNELQNMIVNAIQSCGFVVTEFFNEEDFISYMINIPATKRKDFLVISSAQKGTHIGRKSLIPAFCDLYNISYIGSNPYTVSLCRDKYRCGNILEQNGIRTPKAWLFSYEEQDFINNRPDTFHGLLIIKPNYESSSIGISQNNIGIYSTEFLDKIKKFSTDFKQDILVEEFISGYEVETPIIIADTMVSFFPIGIEKNGAKYIGNEILDYMTRANNDYSLYNFADFNSKLSEKLIQTACKVIRLMNIEGFGRVDYRITKELDFYVTDVSTNPHYTKKSSFFYPFSTLNMTYEQMVACLISTVCRRMNNADTYTQ